MKDGNQQEKHYHISVVVPVNNCEKLLTWCIDNILGQTVDEFELLLVDDGSWNQSSAICGEYALKHNNVFCLHQENKGVSAARNLEIREARGKYIAFVDADDWIEKGYPQILLENMTVHGLTACKCWPGSFRGSSVFKP